ncbi:MAG TPA: prepilin-type N-terminal cleavage/methylation domain-containing protein [Candidatus Nanoarchaeia archaeon]|nr:prepilin-type N-terminal cleavage/methylation domain-containing protein [Candidatus Nanoarchaeia archaeon]
MLLRAQGGFTLIELILATAIFSFMLLIVAQGLLQAYHTQQNSMISRDTEQNARLAMDTMTREARTASDVTYGGAVPNYMCLAVAGGWVEYIINPANHQLERRTLIPAAPCPGPTASIQSLTSPNVWAYELDAIKTAGFGPTYVPTVSISLIVGPKDPSGTLVNHNLCNPSAPSSQFCSVTNLTTTVSLGATTP